MILWLDGASQSSVLINTVKKSRRMRKRKYNMDSQNALKAEYHSILSPNEDKSLREFSYRLAFSHHKTINVGVKRK